MSQMIVRASAVGIAIAILLSGLGLAADAEFQQAEEGQVISGLRDGAQEQSSKLISWEAGEQRLQGASMIVLETQGQGLPVPRGDIGSGWTYDILVSDQAWHANNDGFQSMETDPSGNNDAYIAWECWTDHATGTFQWCTLVRRSTNGGETWSPEIYIFYFPSQINGVYPDMKEPDLAISNSGMIYVTYTVFAYDGPSRNIVDMQLDVQYMSKSSWGLPAPWTSEMVSNVYGGAYNYHRLPSIAFRSSTNVPVIVAMSYDAIAATQSSVIAWLPGATEWDGWEVLPTGPVTANWVQYPCLDSGSSYLYVAGMNYYDAGGCFDMRIWRSTDGGETWTALTDIYDAASVYSFYKPSIAATKSGTDIVMASATYTPNPADPDLGDIAYAYNQNSGTGTWDSYSITQPNYQRMPYVQEYGNDAFLMTYRHESGGSQFSTYVMYADTMDLSSWYELGICSDTGGYQAANWYAHIGIQQRPQGEYLCVAWSDLRDAATPVTETSQSHVVFSTEGMRLNLDTDPTGLDIVVDSVTYTAPQMFNWPAGYEHSFEALEPQSIGPTQYLWDRWSNGMNRIDTIVSGGADLDLVAYYYTPAQTTIDLTEGWNLISLPLVQNAGTDIDTVLASISGMWDRAFAYDPMLSSPWISNNKNRDDALDTLSDLDHEIGFWINITEPGGTTLTVSGVEPVTTDIQLRAGWNLVGYPSQTPQMASTLLAGTGADMIAVENAALPYLIEDISSLSSVVMEQGNGYWVHVPADTVWTVDW